MPSYESPPRELMVFTMTRVTKAGLGEYYDGSRQLVYVGRVRMATEILDLVYLYCL